MKKNITNEIIVIAKDFSEHPGPRNEKIGPHSGAKFYLEVLKPKFSKIWESDHSIEINFDNTFPYPPSFISEVFTSLTKDFKDKEKIKKKLLLISNDDPLLIDKIIYTINETEIS